MGQSKLYCSLYFIGVLIVLSNAAPKDVNLTLSNTGTGWDDAQAQSATPQPADDMEDDSSSSSTTQFSVNDDFTTTVTSDMDDTANDNSSTVNYSLPLTLAELQSTLSNYFTSALIGQCNVNTTMVDIHRPAMELYHCISSNVPLMNFFQSTGIQLTFNPGQLDNPDTAEDSYNQLFIKDKSFVVNKPNGMDVLKMLLQGVANHVDNLCMNIDPLMQCVDTYLQTCYPVSTTPLTLQNDDDSQMSTTDSSFDATTNPFLQNSTNNDMVMPQTDGYTTLSSDSSSNSTSNYDAQWAQDFGTFLNMFDTNRTDDSSSASTDTPVTSGVLVGSATEMSSDQPNLSNDTGRMMMMNNAGMSFFPFGWLMDSLLQPDLSMPMDSNSTNGTKVVIVEIDYDIPLFTSNVNELNKRKLDEQRDNDLQGFFGVPFLTNAQQISGLIRSGLQVLCESNGDVGGNGLVGDQDKGRALNSDSRPFQDVLDNIPCMLSASSDANDQNGQMCGMESDRLEDASNQVTAYNFDYSQALTKSQSNDSSSNQMQLNFPQLCSALEDYFECNLMHYQRQCNPNAIDTVYAVVDLYKDAINGHCRSVEPPHIPSQQQQQPQPNYPLYPSMNMMMNSGLGLGQHPSWMMNNSTNVHTANTGDSTNGTNNDFWFLVTK